MSGSNCLVLLARRVSTTVFGTTGAPFIFHIGLEETYMPDKMLSCPCCKLFIFGGGGFQSLAKIKKIWLLKKSVTPLRYKTLNIMLCTIVWGLCTANKQHRKTSCFIFFKEKKEKERKRN